MLVQVDLMSVISVLGTVIVLAWFGAIIWKRISHYSVPSLITSLILVILLLVIYVFKMTIEIQTDKSYALSMFMTIGWIVNAILDSYHLGKAKK